MSAYFLLEQTHVGKEGSGPAIEVEGGALLQITLGVVHIVEQESLDLAIYGSPDGQVWSEKPIAAIPQKFYKGLYTILLDLSSYPEIRYLQARWKTNRWGRGDLTPDFTIYVAAEPVTVAG